MNWTPNEKQKLFMETLKNAKKPLTLHQASKIAGVEFKTGSTNPLITKKMVVGEKVDIDCNVVEIETGEVLGTTKKKVMAYSLVE